MGAPDGATGTALGEIRGLAGGRAGSRPRPVGTQGAAGFPRKPGELHGLAQPKKPLFWARKLSLSIEKGNPGLV